jgi:hypothetical protein
MVVAAGTGVAAFAVAGGFAAAASPAAATGTSTAGRSAPCGVITQVAGKPFASSRCIPSLQATAVVAAVEAEGFFCEESAGSRVCTLFVGATQFELWVHPPYEDDEGLIEDVSASVTAAPDADLAGIALPYLSWVASLPFGDDPAASQVTTWTEQQIADGRDARARIVDYEYELTHRGSSIELKVHPRTEVEDQMLGDN